MNPSVRTALSVAIIVLLVGILAILATIAVRGVRIEHAGTVALTGMVDEIALRMPDAVTLEMPGAVVASLSSEELPLNLQLVSCPECGGSMVPVRLDLWSGRIEWACPVCGTELRASP